MFNEPIKVVPEDAKGNPNTVTYSSGAWMEKLADKYGPVWNEYRALFAGTNELETADQVANELELPITLAVELVNRCNLKCVMCWTDNHSLPRAFINLDVIERELKAAYDKEKPIPAVVVGLGSEIMLSKDSRKIVELCKKYGVMDLFFGTNGVLLDSDMSTFLIESEVTRVEISLDAATRETYQRIRGKDQFDKVKENVLNLIRLRKMAGKNLPVIRLCFVVQELNKHERKQFLNQWSGLVDYVDFQQLQDTTKVNEFLGKNLNHFTSNDESDDLKRLETERLLTSLNKENIVSKSALFCPYPFNSLNVWSDGEITPC